MASAPVFGRLDEPESLNLKPFTFQLVGYRKKTTSGVEEVTTEFTCSGVRPFGAWLDLLQSSAPGSGITPLTTVVHYIEQSLVDDDERGRFRETLADPDVFYDSGVLGAVSNWLAETYNERPTLPPTGSPGGRSGGGRKSSAAASAKAGGTSGNGRRR